MKRPRISLLVALGIVAVSVTGCGSSDDKGLPVHVVNESAWNGAVGTRDVIYVVNTGLGKRVGTGARYVSWTATPGWEDPDGWPERSCR